MGLIIYCDNNVVCVWGRGVGGGVLLYSGVAAEQRCLGYASLRHCLAREHGCVCDRYACVQLMRLGRRTDTYASTHPYLVVAVAEVEAAHVHADIHHLWSVCVRGSGRVGSGRSDVRCHLCRTWHVCGMCVRQTRAGTELAHAAESD